MGAGLPMVAGDLAFKANFATLASQDDGRVVVQQRRVDRCFEAEGRVLSAYLDGMYAQSERACALVCVCVDRPLCG